MAAPAWVIAYLNRANVINTPPNQTFLEQWASHSGGSCKNNHTDLTQSVAGSSRCGDTVGPFGRSQNYATVGEAAHAFSIQLHTAWVKPLLDALDTGNPFQFGDRTQVLAVLNRWGSTTFAVWYANANSDGSSGSKGGGGGKAARAHNGWNDLRHSINHNLPKALRTSERHTTAALRALSKARKVRL